MKIYKLYYDSYGDELCGEYFSTKIKVNKYMKKLIEEYKLKKDNFKIEEISVK
jgi:hypothetical protein